MGGRSVLRKTLSKVLNVQMTEPLRRASGIPFKCTDECQKLSMSYQIRRSHFENVNRMISADFVVVMMLRAVRNPAERSGS